MGFTSNGLGAIHRAEYYGNIKHNDEPYRFGLQERRGNGPLPEIHEGYFEWIDTLKAVDDYIESAEFSRPFVFVELGAGFGGPSVNAICALRQKMRNAPFLVVAAEADRDHFAWLEQNMTDNYIPAERCRLFNAPVAGSVRTVHFQSGDPRNWYGQAIIDAGYARFLTREPRGIFKSFIERRKVRQVQTITLAEMLTSINMVDIINMDIQGAEGEVIKASADLLDMKAARLHIGTHSLEVENMIRDILFAHDWKNEHDYGCLGQRSTPFGLVAFGDGVQSWMNPRLH